MLNGRLIQLVVLFVTKVVFLCVLVSVHLFRRGTSSMVLHVFEWSCLVIAFWSCLVLEELVLVFQDVHFHCVVLLQILYLVI